MSRGATGSSLGAESGRDSGGGPDDQRVGVLTGDRPCTKCQFNLAGQPVLRERHYGLLIAVCPECGAAAALQEYPLLGRWVNRIGFVLGAGWLLILLALLAINVVAFAATSVAITQGLLNPYAQHLRTENAAYQNANSPPPASASVWGIDLINGDWWQRQDHAAMFARAGGWAHGLDWSALLMLPIPALLALAFGGLWAVALPHARGWARAAPLAAVCAVGVAVLLIADTAAETGARGPWSWRGAEDTVYADFHWPLFPITMAVFALTFAAGLWSGRAAARGIIVAFLPPRLRGPWSFLWLADGKALPRP